MNWLYGESWENYPIEPGEVWGLPDGSQIAVHNIFDELPLWMRADLVFVDPPWNLGNLNTFYTKAGRTDYQKSFDFFLDTLICRLVEIKPRTAYVEMGKQNVEMLISRLEEKFKFIQSWPVTYYRRNPCWIIRASHDGLTEMNFSGMDEADVIAEVGRLEEYTRIADPCMGRGLVGMAAFKSGHSFLGTDINKRRLAVLLEKLAKAGGEIGLIRERL